MKIKPSLLEEYQSYVSKKQDLYGKGIIYYSEQWANLMESELAQGKKLVDIAKETSHKTNTDGITGFMYGCAASALAHFWEHGEELRQWHNLDTQLGNEGIKANETDGTLNPACITIDTSK